MELVYRYFVQHRNYLWISASYVLFLCLLLSPTPVSLRRLLTLSLVLLEVFPAKRQFFLSTGAAVMFGVRECYTVNDKMQVNGHPEGANP